MPPSTPLLLPGDFNSVRQTQFKVEHQMCIFLFLYWKKTSPTDQQKQALNHDGSLLSSSCFHNGATVSRERRLTREVTGHFSSRVAENEKHEEGDNNVARLPLVPPTAKVTFWWEVEVTNNNYPSTGSAFFSFLPASWTLLPWRCRTVIFTPAERKLKIKMTMLLLPVCGTTKPRP